MAMVTVKIRPLVVILPVMTEMEVIVAVIVVAVVMYMDVQIQMRVTTILTQLWMMVVVNNSMTVANVVEMG